MKTCRRVAWVDGFEFLNEMQDMGEGLNGKVSIFNSESLARSRRDEVNIDLGAMPITIEWEER